MTSDVVNNSFIARMLTLHEAISDLAAEHTPMPDDAMDALTDAAGTIAKAIIAAPVTSEGDIANKFRFAADLIEDRGGLMMSEPCAVFGALTDLAVFRNNEWQEAFGQPSPWYGESAA